MIQIIYPTPDLIPSFYECLKEVAAEKIYIEMIEPPPLEKVTNFQTSVISKNGAVYYAVDNGKVIGWADIFPFDNPRLSHRGSLGMGMLKSYRGQGIGTRLLEATLKKAKDSGLEKIELTVYTSNPGGIALYKKMGFVEEGLIKAYRKLDGVSYDGLLMAKFL